MMKEQQQNKQQQCHLYHQTQSMLMDLYGLKSIVVMLAVVLLLKLQCQQNVKILFLLMLVKYGLPQPFKQIKTRFLDS
jgi:hypothetical protein